MTGGMKGHVRDRPGLADDEDLDGLRNLTTSEDRGVDELPALRW